MATLPNSPPSPLTAKSTHDDTRFTLPSEHASPWDSYQFDTRAVRAGQVRTAELEHNEPIFPSSSFVFESAAQAARRFADEEPGNVYSRFTNPSVRMFEQRLASLEGVDYGLATGSGMGAILTLALTVLKAGDHVVASQGLFGSTVSLFANVLSRLGVNTDFVPLTDNEGWRRAVNGNTKMLFVETPSNPLCEVADLDALHVIAREHGLIFVVDNCFCTPALQQPFAFGADVVVHSATKYLDGQGRCVGGALVTDDEELHKKLFATLRTTGASLSPFNAWVFNKGLETLNLRMRAHCDNARSIAEFLDRHQRVSKVYYPGLPNHPQHALAGRQQRDFGGIVAFELGEDRHAAWRLIDGLNCYSITANLGDVKSTVTHPASTTHGRLTQTERDRAGIGEGLVRISVGLESIDDLIGDLDQALDAC